MCGAVDVAIPTQNKDVCKSCDSSFWYNSKLNVAFKFCKGCKNFVTLEMFADKPDASKCCRCRRRGRENYLTKKYSEVQEMPSPFSGNFVPSPIHLETAVMASPTSIMSSVKALDSLRSGAPPLVPAPLMHICTPHAAAESTEYGSSSGAPLSGTESDAFPFSSGRKPYKKRAFSVDETGQHMTGDFYGDLPLKPPKTPRSASCTLDATGSSVSATASTTSSAPRISRMGSLGTPGGTSHNTVTPGSNATSYGSASSTQSMPGKVRFARSDSVGSVEAHNAPTQTGRAYQPQYLWDRTSCQGSPMVDASNSASGGAVQLPSIRSLQEFSAAEASRAAGDANLTAKYLTVRFAEAMTECAADRSSPGNKENTDNRVSVITALQGLPMFQEHAAVKTPLTPAYTLTIDTNLPTTQDGEHDSSSAKTPGATSPTDSVGSQDTTPRCLAGASLRRVDSLGSYNSTSSRASPASAHWEWDPEFNPLMHLAAMISDHR
jgi:hypothetical protein